MTTFVYNGINFGYVKTSRIGHEAVRDQMSDTDLLYTKFTLQISSVVAFAPNAVVRPEGGGNAGVPTTEPATRRAAQAGVRGAEAGAANTLFSNLSEKLSPAELVKQIRHMLLTPRRQLLLSYNGKIMLNLGPVNNSGDAYDDANGPKPESVEVHHISDGMFAIDYVITICLKDCEAAVDSALVNRTGESSLRTGGGAFTNLANRAGALGRINKNDWASFRYTVSQDIDERGMSVVRTAGKLITRTSLLAKGGPDMMRNKITPPPLPGFVRKSSYEVQADGLGLAFHFTDTELYISPPPGTAEASGTITCSTNMGGKWVVEASVHLVARKEVDKQLTMEMALAICLDAIRRQKPMSEKGKKFPQLVKAILRSEMYGPGVDVTLQAYSSGPTKTIGNKKQGNRWAQAAKLASGLFTTNLGGAAAAASAIDALFNNATHNDENVAEPKIIDAFDFGGDPLGSDKMEPFIHTFGERGYAPWLFLLAAGFNDPCLEKVVAPVLGPTESSLRTGPNRPNLPGVVAPITGALRLLFPNSPADAGYWQRLGTQLQRQGAKRNGDEARIRVVETADVFDVSENLYVADIGLDGIWDTWLCEHTYVRDTGYRGLPAMQSAGGTAFVRLHDETLNLKVTWIGKKIGNPPTPPDADSLDTNLQLLNAVETWKDTKEMADGQTLEYTIAGEYLYGVKDPTAVTKRWPVPPWLAVDPGALNAPVYTAGVIGDADAVAPNARGQIVGVGA